MWYSVECGWIGLWMRVAVGRLIYLFGCPRYTSAVSWNCSLLTLISIYLKKQHILTSMLSRGNTSFSAVLGKAECGALQALPLSESFNFKINNSSLFIWPKYHHFWLSLCGKIVPSPITLQVSASSNVGTTSLLVQGRRNRSSNKSTQALTEIPYIHGR